MTFELYVDDSGSRKPDHKITHAAEKDAFALGGILIPKECREDIITAHKKITEKFGITYPLHSSSIRSKRGPFIWLAKDQEKATEFYQDLDAFFASFPGYVTACVIHRPGYNERYAEKYADDRWKLCKTAYGILVERCVKFALAHDRRLRISVEQTGRREDKAIEEYHRALREEGLPFDAGSSSKHEPVSAEEFSSVLMKNPAMVTKEFPPIQFADLALYPLIAGKYNPEYRPYKSFVENGKILEVPGTERYSAVSGVKYSCFD